MVPYHSIRDVYLSENVDGTPLHAFAINWLPQLAEDYEWMLPFSPHVMLLSLEELSLCPVSALVVHNFCLFETSAFTASHLNHLPLGARPKHANT